MALYTTWLRKDVKTYFEDGRELPPDVVKTCRNPHTHHVVHKKPKDQANCKCVCHNPNNWKKK
jgi:hypothetical protein